MNRRFTLWATAFLGTCVALWACPGRPPPPGEDAGCIGVCSQDAGADAGQDAGVDAGVDAGTTDAGTQIVTLAELRDMTPAAQHVIVNGVVVSGVNRVRSGTSGCNTANPGSTRAEFWVVDPGNADAGFFIWKYCAGAAATATYSPDAGDQLNIDGYLIAVSPTENRIAYRPALSDSTQQPGASRMAITVTAIGQARPPAVEVGDAGVFGDAMGGTRVPDFANRSEYVHVNGPIEITNAMPQALFSMATPTPDGGFDRNGNPMDGGAYSIAYAAGFEATGGILVVDSTTRTGCDWRAAADAGSRVVFPDGLRGFWDTYAQVPFCNPFPGCLENGYVPGANDAGYTMVLYPQTCADLDGGVVP